ncbi:hypothetical protein EV424DRAFT_1537175 [Suillus variegatus]|nr:hypothetical protein EV424DRAFT_1537175 [Suillus variegatus]
MIPLLTLAGRALNKFSRSTSPGVFMIDSTPYLALAKVPEWLPGAGFKPPTTSPHPLLLPTPSGIIPYTAITMLPSLTHIPQTEHASCRLSPSEQPMMLPSQLNSIHSPHVLTHVLPSH